MPNQIQFKLKHGKLSEFTCTAERETHDAFDELSVSIAHKHDPNRAAEVFITMDRRSNEPVIYITTDGDISEHKLAVYPLRPKRAAVEKA